MAQAREQRRPDTKSNQLVVGILPDLSSAKAALQDLRSQGIPEDHIGLAMRQPDEERPPASDAPDPAAEDAAAGAMGGGLIGGITGLLTATGVVVIPGLAPLLAVGTLASVFGVTGASVIAGAGVGAATGGLVGGLVGINVPESAARRYDEAVREGRVLITVKTTGDAGRVQALLQRHGADTGVG